MGHYYRMLNLIISGNSKFSPLIAKLCGGTMPAPDTYISTTKHMTIVLTTDSTVHHAGYTIEYKEIQPTQPSCK